jgi:uncharacterized protein YecT (DUF1311 family)
LADNFQRSPFDFSLGIIRRMKMNTTIGVPFATIILAASALAQTGTQPKTKSCWDTAMSQAALNDCARSDLRNADRELNQVYQALLKKISGDSIATENLKISEHAWLIYHDAQLKALHPHPDQE